MVVWTVRIEISDEEMDWIAVFATRREAKAWLKDREWSEDTKVSLKREDYFYLGA